MTFAIGHVEGGTRAGRKRPLREKPKPWRCDCPCECFRCEESCSSTFLLPGYLTCCTYCGARRDA